jgi:aminoglycoside phosphotransferase (APT) family kinase protein
MPDDEIERLLGRSILSAERAEWGFQNRTDLVTLASGERVVVQRYRRREEAEYRVRAMRGLHGPAAAAGIAIPRVRKADLDADPPWVAFDALVGEPIAAVGLDDARFAGMARAMGKLLAAFRTLPTAGLDLDDRWADPSRLAAHAADWTAGIPEAGAVAEQIPALFSGRPAVLAHGDFAPVNVLTDGTSLTGLLDFESVRLADPLFDAAWWSWSVSFGPPGVLASAWPGFLQTAGIDANDPNLEARVHALQILRMCELLAGGSLDGSVRTAVENRLRQSLRYVPS